MKHLYRSFKRVLVQLHFKRTYSQLYFFRKAKENSFPVIMIFLIYNIRIKILSSLIY
jgi:hypothetical protein